MFDPFGVGIFFLFDPWAVPTAIKLHTCRCAAKLHTCRCAAKLHTCRCAAVAALRSVGVVHGYSISRLRREMARIPGGDWIQ